MPNKLISGFSKKSKLEKIEWLAEHFYSTPSTLKETLESYWHSDDDTQKVFDEISENTLSNYFLPFGIAPNFIIDEKPYAIPMVIEESSVVAAAAAAAKFWMNKGGFKTKVIATEKIGQVHFQWFGDSALLFSIFEDIKQVLIKNAQPITANMDKRGGGILDIVLKDRSDIETGFYQLHASFETCDSMGANFINSVLESFAQSLQTYIADCEAIPEADRAVTIVMSILSNYTPNCLVRASVSCPIEDLGIVNGLDAQTFAKKFNLAVKIAQHDVSRATTHNKGFFNGVDAVALATANDFRAIEACGHAYCAKDGQYRSISSCSIEDGNFSFWVDLPIALGTVGGLTKLHPIAKTSLDLLGNPSAQDLMKIMATVGLAQNFAAVRSLVTTGIQQGHMKMHLTNILNEFKATTTEVQDATKHFEDKLVSYSAVRTYLSTLRLEKA